jgi:Na+/phosphate symporter
MHIVTQEVNMALKDQVFDMHDLISDMVDDIDSLYTAFIYSNIRLAEEVSGTAEGIGGRVSALTEGVAALKDEEPRARMYVGVPAHMGRIGDGLARVAQSIAGKIREKALFSDKAMAELDYMFGRTRDIIVNARDMVLAPNTLVARHMAESARAVEIMADDYSTKHEERLIEGLCAPKSSQLFLQMLDAFKTIAWHSKEIAKDLSGQP